MASTRRSARFQALSLLSVTAACSKSRWAHYAPSFSLSVPLSRCVMASHSLVPSSAPGSRRLTGRSREILLITKMSLISSAKNRSSIFQKSLRAFRMLKDAHQLALWNLRQSDHTARLITRQQRFSFAARVRVLIYFSKRTNQSLNSTSRHLNNKKPAVGSILSIQLSKVCG